MRITRPKFALMVGLALCILAGGAYADESEREYRHAYPRYAEPPHETTLPLIAARGDDWNNLSPEEQRALNAHRTEWDRYPPQRRARLRSGAQRYLNLTPEQRSEVQRGRERYERMSPEERERVRERYRRSHERDD